MHTSESIKQAVIKSLQDGGRVVEVLPLSEDLYTPGNISNISVIQAGNLKVAIMDVAYMDDFNRLLRNINTVSALTTRDPYRRPQITIVNPVGEWESWKFQQIQNNDGATMKFVVDPQYSVEACLAGIPAITRLVPKSDIRNPVWLEKISFGSSFGHNIDKDVTIELEASQGILVIHGSNNTGKSYLLNSVMRQECPLEWSGVPPEANMMRPQNITYSSVDLPKFRKLIGYGQPDGTLLMPIEFEGKATQRLESIGSTLLKNADIYKGWNGLILDTPTQGLDGIKCVKLIETIVRMAEDRQVIISSRDINEAKTWMSIAEDHNVNAITGSLNSGDLEILKKPIGLKI